MKLGLIVVVLSLWSGNSNCRRPGGLIVAHHPQQLFDWTEGRALIGTGSPFAPVQFQGRPCPVDQVNNAYIFPGLALGIISSRARLVTDGMIMAAAKALAEIAQRREDKHVGLLPSLSRSREVSLTVAEAVGKQAIAQSLAEVHSGENLKDTIRTNIWEPVYLPYERIEGLE